MFLKYLFEASDSDKHTALNNYIIAITDAFSRVAIENIENFFRNHLALEYLIYRYRPQEFMFLDPGPLVNMYNSAIFRQFTPEYLNSAYMTIVGYYLLYTDNPIIQSLNIDTAALISLIAQDKMIYTVFGLEELEMNINITRNSHNRFFSLPSDVIPFSDEEVGYLMSYEYVIADNPLREYLIDHLQKTRYIYNIWSDNQVRYLSYPGPTDSGFYIPQLYEYIQKLNTSFPFSYGAVVDYYRYIFESLNMENHDPLLQAFRSFDFFDQWGTQISSISSYSDFVDELHSAAFDSSNRSTSYVQQSSQARDFRRYLREQFTDLESLDELIKDYDLMTSLIHLQFIFQHTKVESSPYNHARYTHAAFIICCSGSYSDYISDPSGFFIQVMRLSYLLLEFEYTRLRPINQNVARLVITFALIKLKTLYKSQFEYFSFRYGYGYAQNVYRYLMKFCIARAVECIDFSSNLICQGNLTAIKMESTNEYRLGTGTRVDPIYGQYYIPKRLESTRANLKLIFDEHVSRLLHFVRARNNLIYILPQRLPQLLQLLRRHTRQWEYLTRTERAFLNMGESVFDLAYSRKTIIPSPLMGYFNVGEFWDQALVLMQYIFEASRDPDLTTIGYRKSRFLETIFLDWGTFRILAQYLNVSPSPNYRNYAAIDNFSLIYGPSNAYIFYGINVKYDYLFPDIDETTLSYDVRRILRPDVDTNLSIYASKLVNNSIASTLSILKGFVYVFSKTIQRRKLSYLDDYAEQRYNFLIAALYAIEIFDSKFCPLISDDNRIPEQDFQNTMENFDRIISRYQKLADRIDLSRFVGLSKEITTTYLETRYNQQRRDQIKMRRARNIAILQQDRYRILEKVEAKFYLNYIYTSAVSKVRTAIYQAYVKNSYHIFDSVISLDSPLFLTNLQDFMQTAVKQLVRINVIRLFDLQASFYSEMKYRLINDDLYVFLTRRKLQLTPPYEVVLLVDNGLDDEDNRENVKILVNTLDENEYFRSELINQLQVRANENLEDFRRRVQQINDTVQYELQVAAELETDLRRRLDVPIVSRESEAVLQDVLVRGEAAQQEIQRSADELASDLEAIRVNFQNLIPDLDEDIIRSNFDDFVRRSSMYTASIAKVSSRTITLLRQRVPFSETINLTQQEIDNFIDQYYLRISQAIRTRLTTRATTGFLGSLGPEGVSRLSLILSDQDRFRSLVSAILQDEKGQVEENQTFTNIIIRYLAGREIRAGRISVERKYAIQQFIDAFLLQ